MHNDRLKQPRSPERVDFSLAHRLEEIGSAEGRSFRQRPCQLLPLPMVSAGPWLEHAMRAHDQRTIQPAGHGSGCQRRPTPQTVALHDINGSHAGSLDEPIARHPTPEM